MDGAPEGEAVKQRKGKFLLAGTVILGTTAWLGWVGVTESKTYYYTIAELKTLSGAQAQRRLRVGGDVQPGSIERLRGRVDFVLEQEGHTLPVSYVGQNPLPDTFVDRAQALVEGRLAPDGRFLADHVQAKCASKYEAVPNPSTTTSSSVSSPAGSSSSGQPE